MKTMTELKAGEQQSNHSPKEYQKPTFEIIELDLQSAIAGSFAGDVFVGGSQSDPGMR